MYAAAAALLQEESLSITAVCEVLPVSRSAFYAWQQAAPTVHEDRDASL